MLRKLLVTTALLPPLCVPTAFASDFAGDVEINSSALSSIIAASNVYMDIGGGFSATGGIYSANQVSDAFKGTTGIIGIVQNTGTSSNVQQSVNVQIRSLSIGGTSFGGAGFTLR